MKRLFIAGLIAVGLITTALPSMAQVQLGIRGGAHWGAVTKPSALSGFTPDINFSPGPTGALFLEAPLSDRVSFRPEIAYVQKGFLLREGFDLNLGAINIPIGARVSYQMHTVQVPLLAKVRLGDGPVQPYLFAGPAVGYTVDGRVRTRATAFLQSRPFDVDLNASGLMNKWDISAVGGLGLALEAGAGKLFAEARYDHGFTRQVEVPVVNLPVRNRGVSVSLGYSFPLSR